MPGLARCSGRGSCDGSRPFYDDPECAEDACLRPQPSQRRHSLASNAPPRPKAFHEATGALRKTPCVVWQCNCLRVGVDRIPKRCSRSSVTHLPEATSRGQQPPGQPCRSYTPAHDRPASSNPWPSLTFDPISFDTLSKLEYTQTEVFGPSTFRFLLRSSCFWPIPSTA